jgi:hypothetical protein
MGTRVFREKREVLPITPKEEAFKFGNASSWGREQIRVLGVDFYMQRRIDLNRILGVKESDWSPELRARSLSITCTIDYLGIQEGTRQLAAVDMNELNYGIVEMDDVSNRIAPKFSATFLALLKLMEIQEMKERAKLIKAGAQNTSHASSSATTLKRPADNNPIIAPKRVKSSRGTPSPPPEPTTPDRPTYPSNSDFTGASTISTTSQDEENTKKLLFLFIMNTLNVLGLDFRQITWQRNGYRVELNQT